MDLVSYRSRLRGIATGLRFLDDRLWCRGSNTFRGSLLLLGGCSLIYREWEWSQRPEDDSPGSGGRPGVLRVVERGDASATGRALASTLTLLLLKHELVLVLIEGDG